MKIKYRVRVAETHNIRQRKSETQKNQQESEAFEAKDHVQVQRSMVNGANTVNCGYESEGGLLTS